MITQPHHAGKTRRRQHTAKCPPSHSAGWGADGTRSLDIYLTLLTHDANNPTAFPEREAIVPELKGPMNWM